MNSYELLASPLTNAMREWNARQAGLWTALPGIIQSFNAQAQTCVVQPAIKAVVFDQDGTPQNVALPLLVDCPTQFTGGGGCTLTFPVAQGDECLVVFASRCIDAWWASGGIQAQAELRMHDLSDGFAILGYRSQPRVLTAVSTTAAQLRTDDGNALVGVNPTSHEIDVTTTGPVNITSAVAVNVVAPAVNIGASGQTLMGLVTAAFVAFFNNHNHNDPQGGVSSVPNQQMGSTHLTTTIKGG